MKKLPNFLVLLLVVGLIFSLAGCQVDDDGEDVKGGDSEIDFTNTASSPSIFVENLTGERLVAFKGTLSPAYLIGGIPAYSGQFGLKKDPTLFNATGSFVLILITEKQYNDNKDNLGALNQAVFARVFAFYNHSATNNNVFQISSKIGGEGRLTISNPTAYNVEIRKDGPTGEILGYAASQMTSGNIIYLQAPESYDIYPVFKFFSQVDQELYSVVPKYTSGALEGKPFAKTFGFAGSELTHSFNVSEIEDQGNFNLSSGSVYIKIINNSSEGIRFWDGSTPKLTSMGIEVINSSRGENFSLAFTRNVDGTYPESRNFGQLYIGTNQNRLQVPSQAYDLDYIYEIEITGSNASNLALGTVTKGDKINLNAIFGLD